MTRFPAATHGPRRAFRVWSYATLVALCPLSGHASAQSAPLGWQVYQVFQRHCTECHGGQLDKPKSGFGFVLDLERLRNDPDFVVPGNPQVSEVYLLLVDEDPEVRMPPPDSDVPPVSQGDIALVRRWIEEVTPDAVGIDEPPTSDAASAQDGLSLRRWIGHAHPLVIHFPIALFIAALVAAFGERWSSNASGMRSALRWCLWAGAIGAVAAAATGWINAGYEGYAPDTVFRHRWLGVAVSVLGMVCAALYERACRRDQNARLPPFLLLLLVILAGLVSLSGHTGGVLVYGPDYFF